MNENFKELGLARVFLGPSKKPIPTAPLVEMIDAHIRRPMNGQQVWALGAGGVLVKCTWTSKSIDFFEAWCPYPTVPASVKERMRAKYAPKVVV